MPFFVAEIEETPVLVFAAKDRVDALAFAADDFVRSELCMLTRADGRSLMTEGADIVVREAGAREREIWEADMADGLRGQACESREDAIDGQWFALLVDYREQDK